MDSLLAVLAGCGIGLGVGFLVGGWWVERLTRTTLVSAVERVSRSVAHPGGSGVVMQWPSSEDVFGDQGLDRERVPAWMLEESEDGS